MIKYFIFSILFLSIIGCSTVGHLRTNDSSAVYENSDPNKIEVYSTAKIAKPYNVIGEVIADADADAGESAETPVNKLKVEASKIGADAIINLRLSISEGYWASGIRATGTAIKFK